jgi:hypothetical protein
MKDRMIELISTTTFYLTEGVVATIGSRFTHSFIEAIADSLLANGVIVPPVKVGQTVYRIIVSEKVFESTITAIVSNSDGFRFNVDRYHMFNEKQISYGNNEGRNIYDMLFLTREEAERALKEREQE